jgi:hypothetical protein
MIEGEVMAQRMASKSQTLQSLFLLSKQEWHESHGKQHHQHRHKWGEF